MQGKERIMNKHKVIVMSGMEYDIFMQTNPLRFCDFEFKSFYTKNNYETGPLVFIQSTTQ
jgi:hypothetical protein